MPFLNLLVGNQVDENQKNRVLSSLSQIVCETLSKPQQYMMTSLVEAKVMLGNSDKAAAFVDLRSIGGLNPQSIKMLSQKICSYLNKELAIDTDRIYCNFTDVAGSNWGWNGSTF